MKKWRIILCLLLAIQQLPAQLRQHDATINASTITIPDTANTAAAISAYINIHCKTGYEKIHSLYNWVTTNIHYDTDSMYYYNWSKASAAIAAATIRRRKGVCENFAALFTELLLQAGIQSFVVTGYTKPAGAVSYMGHSWCAVQVDEEWWFCDPTWDAGNGFGTKWLMVAADVFLETHMPFDPLWQLRAYPVTHKEFRQGRWTDKNKSYFNYTDSLKQFLQQDSLQQLEAFTRRMYNAGIENNRIRLWHSYNEMKIAIIYGDKDMELYNTAVALFNQATNIFNGFVQYRNNQFTPARPDEEIKNLLNPIAGLITSAEQHLHQMGLVVENFQYDTGEILERLKSLAVKVKAQQAFINKYIGAKPGERKKLFLK